METEAKTRGAVGRLLSIHSCETHEMKRRDERAAAVRSSNTGKSFFMSAALFNVQQLYQHAQSIPPLKSYADNSLKPYGIFFFFLRSLLQMKKQSSWMSWWEGMRGRRRLRHQLGLGVGKKRFLD